MENQVTKIYLKRKKDNFVRRFHPWIFSGAIQRIEGTVSDGSVVEVYSHQDEFLAIGHYHDGSIAVKIITFEQQSIDLDFWFNKLSKAYALRQRLFEQAPDNKAFRLIHGEGDGLPGLVIDVYATTVVFQAHTVGMYRSRQTIVEALVRLLGEAVTAIYDKSKKTLPPNYAQNVENGYLWGQHQHNAAVINEHGSDFSVNWSSGQKTGFFLDQRNNRLLLANYVKDKRVLNAFCYSGGFSVYALKAGAAEVHSVDASAKAMALLQQNLALNGLENAAHHSYTDDVLKFLKTQTAAFDVMVLDPPAFAKSVSKRHKAVQAYKRLNADGLRLVNSGGILFTFSCSQVVDNELFYNTITAAAIEAKRKVRVLHRLTQPADHPVNIFHPEGNYLKGLVLYVE
jgi:23S rRNA (cytosine1962-C5)-methyltransferase